MSRGATWSWGRYPQTPEIFRFMARMANDTIGILERRIGLSRDGTRAPTQGPEWPGQLRLPLNSDPPTYNLLPAKNGPMNGGHFRVINYSGSGDTPDDNPAVTLAWKLICLDAAGVAFEYVEL